MRNIADLAIQMSSDISRACLQYKQTHTHSAQFYKFSVNSIQNKNERKILWLMLHFSSYHYCGFEIAEGY
jgi:hypothetical protein